MIYHVARKVLDDEVVRLTAALLLAHLRRPEHLGLLIRVRLVYGGAELLPGAVACATGAVEQRVEAWLGLGSGLGVGVGLGVGLEQRVEAVGAVLDGGDNLALLLTNLLVYRWCCSPWRR